MNKTNINYRNNLLLFFIAFFLFTLSSPPLFLDPDVAWHIAAGDYITKSKSIPFYDPWSYVGLEQQWYNISWLWDILCSFLNQLVGFHGLSIVLTVFLSLICTYCYQSLVSRKYPISHDAIMISLALTSLLFIEIGCLRPQLISCIMITFFMNKLYNFYYLNDEKALNKLPFATLIWTNSHGGFLILYALLGVFMAIAVYEKNKVAIKKIIKISITCSLTTLINPTSYKIYIGSLRTLNSVVIDYINEWRPFFFGQSYSFSMLFLVLIMAGCAFHTHYTELRIKNSDWLIGLAFLIASLLSVRNFSNLAISGMPFIAGIVDRSLPTSKFTVKLKNAHKTLISILLIIVSVSIHAFLVITKDDKKIGLNRVPVELIQYTANNYPGSKIINNYNLGGYIILFGNGKIKHFIDGRAGTAFNERILNEFIDIINRKISVLEIAVKHNVDGVIIHKMVFKQESEIQKKNWNIVYNSKKYYLLIKNK
ncbi:MAG: hypothetical protein AB8V23_01990 [Candidatus Midichloria sp.]